MTGVLRRQRHSDLGVYIDHRKGLSEPRGGAQNSSLSVSEGTSSVDLDLSLQNSEKVTLCC